MYLCQVYVQLSGYEYLVAALNTFYGILKSVVVIFDMNQSLGNHK